MPQVIAIGQATVGPAASEFTVQLVRAMVAEQLDVSVLITTEDASADAQSVLSALVDAGAHDSTWLRVPHDAPKPALERALGRFSKDQWVIVLGNVLPIFYRPLFCALVSAPRSTDIPEARRIAPHADLQVSSPSEKLAVEIAKLIRAKALVRSGSTG
ncbi:MAG TPA: hypothetical protein VHM19_12670 [Polyangiales bacterium]|nr:hypothetical protein [Polyangiales bacterium]